MYSLYTQHRAFPSWDRDPSVALPDVADNISAIIVGFVLEFLLVCSKGLRTEGLICCTYLIIESVMYCYVNYVVIFYLMLSMRTPAS